MIRAACLAAPVLMLSAWPAAARVETYVCQLAAPCPGAAAACVSKTLQVRFSINPILFLPPVLKDDPPYRPTTEVSAGRTRFRAEAILTQNGTRGFWRKIDGVDHLMTVDAKDGSAIYSRTPPGEVLSGECEVTQ